MNPLGHKAQSRDCPGLTRTSGHPVLLSSAWVFLGLPGCQSLLFFSWKLSPFLLQSRVTSGTSALCNSTALSWNNNHIFMKTPLGKWFGRGTNVVLEKWLIRFRQLGCLTLLNVVSVDFREILLFFPESL